MGEREKVTRMRGVEEEQEREEEHIMRETVWGKVINRGRVWKEGQTYREGQREKRMREEMAS